MVLGTRTTPPPHSPNRWRAGGASRNLHAQEGANAASSSADLPRKVPGSRKTPADRASYKLYYVNYEIGLNPRPSHTPVQAVFQPSSLSPTSCRRFLRILVVRVRS